jgi:hypothetical protein
MARTRLIARIAFTGLGLGLFLAPSHGFSQRSPDPRAAMPAAMAQNQADARTETQTGIAKYCTTCHNERTKTAGLALDPAGVARAGDASEIWEKVLRQLRAGTMPPPGAVRPPQAFYSRAADYLAHELEASASARPNPGSLPLAQRLTRTEYANVIRDLLALPDLPKELDYATLLPADNASSGFDNLADTLFVSPASMERYLAAAQKISRVAVGDPQLGALVNTHMTPVRQPQEARNEELPFGTRGGLESTGTSLSMVSTSSRSRRPASRATSTNWRSASTASARRLPTSPGAPAFRVETIRRTRAPSASPCRPGLAAWALPSWSAARRCRRPRCDRRAATVAPSPRSCR